MRVTCKSDVPGPLREQLSISARDGIVPQVVFDVLGTVVPRLAFELPSVHAQMPFGESRRLEVRLVGRLADAASLRIVPDPSAAVGATAALEAMVVPKGVVLRFTANKVGTAVGQLLFTTGLPDPTSLTLPWSRVVQGSLQVTPSNPYLNLKLPGAKQVVLDVSSTQPGFRVVATRVIRGPFVASLEPAGNSPTQRVRVRLREDRYAGDATGTVGTLLISEQ